MIDHRLNTEKTRITFFLLFSITFCGMVMKQYVSFNISKKSDATTEYVIKMLSSIMETIIFMFMGLSTVSDYHSWNTGFVLMTLLACLVYRIIGKSHKTRERTRRKIVFDFRHCNLCKSSK